MNCRNYNILMLRSKLVVILNGFCEKISVMKKYILTLTIIALGLGIAGAQINASMSAVFDVTPINPGQTTFLRTNVAVLSMGQVTAAGDLEVLISFPQGANPSYEPVGTTPPSGPFAGSFNWSFNAGQRTWYGVNPSAFPASAYGGDILFEVVGNHLGPELVTITTVTLAGDTNNLDDNATPSLVVPVKLSSFDVKSSDCNAVNLEWVTETESSNKGFEIERSTDGRNFDKLGFIPATERGTDGSYHYAFEDASIKQDEGQSEYFYRLVQIDLDGRSKVIGSVLSVNLDCREEFAATIYPIPAYSTLTYTLTNNYLGHDLDIEIYSNTGQLVYNGHIEKVLLLEADIDVSKLAVGMYQIRFSAETGVKQYKFMKMK